MKRKVIHTAIIVLLLGLALYALRGPNISNSLKKQILPELELATGQKFIAQKIYVNLLPLFIEMKGVKAFDDDGGKIFEAERVKGYVGIFGLFRKEIVLKKIVVKSPLISADKGKVEEIIENVKKRLAEETKMPFKVVVRTIGVADGSVLFRDRGIEAELKGLSADIAASDNPKFRISAKEVRVAGEHFPGFRGAVDTTLVVKGKEIEIKELKVTSYKSEAKTTGTLKGEKLEGTLQTELNVIVDSLKKMFGLKSRGEGKVSAKGFVKIDDSAAGPGKISIDLKLKGEMYLEALMELLGVKEKLSGLTNVEGRVSGPLNSLKGEGTVLLERGNLFGVEIDRMNCGVAYRDGIMRFTDGRALLYKGTAAADAMITLPVVHHYHVKVSAREVSSKGLFKLIGWDPHISEGRVTGEMETEGSAFDPKGSFHYMSATRGRDVLEKIREIKGDFAMRNNVIRFPQLSLSTGRTTAAVSGEVNLVNNTLALKGNGSTTDLNELSTPYFTAVSGTGGFLCSITGLLKDPLLDLRFKSDRAELSTGALGIPDVVINKMIRFASAEGALTYRKNLLSLRELSVRSAKEEYRASGTVRFDSARELFDMRKPEYDLRISAKGIDIKNLADTFREGPPLSGIMNTGFRLYGRPQDIRADGDVHGENVALYGKYPAYADGKISYRGKRFSFADLRVKRGNSALRVNGSISLSKEFSFAAEGERVYPADVLAERQREMLKAHYKELFVEDFFDTISLVHIRAEGEGTLANPNVKISAEVNSGAYRGRPLGKGDMSLTLKGKHIDGSARLLDRKLLVKGNGTLSDPFPWSARLELQPARYDFIIANFMKDVPEDLLLNMKGTITARGDKDRVDATATIPKAHLYFYGAGFTNSAPIIARLEDRRLSIDSLSMQGDTAEFRLGGNVLVGKGYDLLFEGSSSLAPLKALSKNVETIKGNSSFVFSITGPWEKPKINGDMDIANGTLGFKNLRYRLSSLSAYIYVDEGKIVLERASGKVSGGDVAMTGTAYLEKFTVRRFSLESKLKGITASFSKDFWVNFDGDLYYRGTQDSQALSGDIMVKRAKYTERVEWKSWLLKMRQRERARVEPSKIDMTQLNVRLSVPNFLIDNNVAQSSLRADILMRGTLGQPVFLGKAETKGGIVYFRNNEFKILNATVDFSNPNQIRPYFNIVAETRAKNYNIRLSLDGYVEQFSLSLSSDPPLDETDIFSLLAVGQIGKNLKGLEGGIGASEATSFITGKLQDIVEERVKTITGFDRVQVDPYVSKYTGTVSPRVTVAKRLLGDKLYVTYSSSVTTGEEQILKLEYLVGRNTSLIGVRDERGGLGGDVKFRFEFK